MSYWFSLRTHLLVRTLEVHKEYKWDKCLDFPWWDICQLQFQYVFSCHPVWDYVLYWWLTCHSRGSLDCSIWSSNLLWRFLTIVAHIPSVMAWKWNATLLCHNILLFTPLDNYNLLQKRCNTKGRSSVCHWTCIISICISLECNCYASGTRFLSPKFFLGNAISCMLHANLLFWIMYELAHKTYYIGISVALWYISQGYMFSEYKTFKNKEKNRKEATIL